MFVWRDNDPDLAQKKNQKNFRRQNLSTISKNSQKDRRGPKSFAISIVNIIIFIDTTDLINSHYARILARRAAAVRRRQRWRALLQVPGKGEKPPQRKRKAIELWTFYLCLLTMVYSPLELLKIWKGCRWSWCTWEIGGSLIMVKINFTICFIEILNQF